MAPLEPNSPVAGASALAERLQAKYADRSTGALTIPASASDYVPFPADQRRVARHNLEDVMSLLRLMLHLCR